MPPPRLFPYQLAGAHWLAARTRALLADEMGLGKTCQAIYACDLIQAKTILVLCPAGARDNWVAEFARCSAITRSQTVLWTRASGPAADLTICSYDYVATSDANSPCYAKRWEVVIFDEAQYLKNRTAKRTRHALALARAARHVFALSGTPAPNHAGELFPLLHFFGALGTLDYWSYLRRYCRVVDTVYGPQIHGSQRIPELRARMAPYILRRKKEDVMSELPPISFSHVAVAAGPVDVSCYFKELIGTPRAQFEARLQRQQAAIDAVISCLGTGDGGLRALAPLQTTCSESRRVVGLQKVASVADLVARELTDRAYDKLVVFGIHRDVLQELRERLSAFKAAVIYGGTPPEKRTKHLYQFQTNPRARVLLANIQAAGTAINLTAAHQVAFIEASWVPAENAQAAMRCHRIGQTKPVTVRFFYLPGSSDERVQKVLCRKTRDITAIVDGPAGVEPHNPFAE